MNFVFSAIEALIPNFGLRTGYRKSLHWLECTSCASANWVLYCLRVPGAKCGRAAALQCPATNYRGQLAVCRPEGDMGYLRSCGYWLNPKKF